MEDGKRERGEGVRRSAALVSSLTARILTHSDDMTPGKRIPLSDIFELIKEKEEEGRE